MFNLFTHRVKEQKKKCGIPVNKYGFPDLTYPEDKNVLDIPGMPPSHGIPYASSLAANALWCLAGGKKPAPTEFGVLLEKFFLQQRTYKFDAPNQGLIYIEYADANPN